MMQEKTRPFFASAVVAGACLLAIASSMPAWTGEFIYDDLVMATSPLMNDVDDLSQVFSRTSAQYLAVDETNSISGITYRPLSMASLIAVHAVRPTPLPHHLLSLALHLTVVVLLYLTLKALCDRNLAAVLAATFGLHPLCVEAYGWINGRSDVLSGLGLTIMALGFARRARPWALPAIALGASVAGLSKETGLVAGAFLTLAFALPATRSFSLADVKSAIAPSLAALAGAMGALLPRLLVAKLHNPGSPSFWADLTSPTLMGRLFGIALEQVAIPAPRTMLGLAWQLDQPMSLARQLLLALGLLGVVMTLARGHFRSGVLLFGALLAIAPCSMVRHGLWNGLDRYLYMPCILTCLAIASAVPAHVGQAWSSRASTAVIAAGMLVLSFSTYATSTFYSSEAQFLASMIQQRPDDPTGYLMASARSWTWGQRDVAAEMLSHINQDTLPPGLALEMASHLRAMKRHDEELRLIARLEARKIDDPYLWMVLSTIRLYYGNLDLGLAHAAQLRGHPPQFCRTVRNIVADSLKLGKYSRNEAKRAKAEAFVKNPSCLVPSKK